MTLITLNRIVRLLFLMCFCTERAISITELRIAYNMNEMHAVGFNIGNLMQDTPVASMTGGKNLQFDLQKPNHWFNVQSFTGIITVKNLVDLEDLCSTRSACPAGGIITLNVVVKIKEENLDNTKTFAMVAVTVNINDINDNLPKFEESPVFEKILVETQCITIPNICILREFPLPIAKDRDFSSLNNKLTYTLDRTDDTFALKVKNAEPFMEILKGLDYERQKEYEFRLEAKDINGNSDKIIIKIKILNYNDNVPAFAQSQYETNVSENTTRGSVIYTLTAKDADENSILSYKIKSSVFQIDDNGVVRTTAKLDYEYIKRYDLQVTVADSQYSNTTYLIVHITDVNDNAPEWKLQSSLVVQENSPPASIIVVRVFDQDSGVNGNVVCLDQKQGRNRDAGLLFQRRAGEHNAFELLTTKQFDREVNTTISAFLICYDGGFPSLTATLTQTVEVGDRNDNAPRFAHGDFSPSIMENLEAGVTVTQITARDEDFGLNGQVYYKLATSEFSDTFHIDNSTGRITLLKSLDRETRQLYSIKVLAIDFGKPTALTGTTFINITVLDDNDHAPRFSNIQNLKLPENSKPPFLVGQIKAIDDDDGVNAKLLFEQLTNVNKHGFTVHANGTVVAEQSFDREAFNVKQDQQEQQDCVYIKVCVKDMGNGNTACGPSIAPEQIKDFCITILDENDETPTFIQPSNFSTPIVISIHTHLVGHKVVQFLAQDLDKDENARITYSIEDYSLNSKMFTINAQTGLLTLNRKLRRDDIMSKKLVVTATDHGQTPRKSSNIVTIVITDEPAKNAVSDEIITEMQTRRNIMIIIVLASVSAILAIILIMAILCVNRPCCTSPWPNVHVSSMRSSKYPQSHLSHLTEDGLDCLANNRMDDAAHLHSVWPLSNSELLPPAHQQQQQNYRHHHIHDEQFILRERLLDTQNSNVLLDNKRGLCVDKLAMTIDGRAINGNSLCTVNNPPPRYATTGRVAKPAKSEQVKFWLYQIKEDGPASPSRSIRPPGCPRQQGGVDILDGGQSDSGRGCSDEDLFGSVQCNGLHQQQASNYFRDTFSTRVGNSCKSCSGQISMETFQAGLGEAEDIDDESVRSRYETCSPHKQYGGKDTVTYEMLHSTCFNTSNHGDELLPSSGQQTPATLRKLPGALITPPAVLVGVNAAQFPQTVNKFV